MPLARIGSKVLFFAHIPKTGGTSVETYLRSKGAVALHFGRRLGWSRSTVQHMEAHVHRRIIPDDFFDASFAILRDPVARIVSEYRYRLDRNASQPPFETWLRRAFDAHDRSAYALDNHIRPQTDFLRPGMVVFRLEDGLGPVFDWIDAATDTQPAPREVWEKKSAAAAVEVSDAARDLIAAFYRSDLDLLARMRPGQPV